MPVGKVRVTVLDGGTVKGGRPGGTNRFLQNDRSLHDDNKFLNNKMFKF